MLSAQEVTKHNNRESCWVIVQEQVYDVTDFLDEHPGGAEIVLRYAGKDATEEYLPVHPPGTIEKELPKEKHLGKLDPESITPATSQVAETPKTEATAAGLPMTLVINLDDMERAAKMVVTERAWTYYSSAADDLISETYNLNDWKRVSFRPRVLRNVQRVDMQRKILGHSSSLPIFIAPAALARLGHPDGELCLARGAARYNIPYAVSTASSVSAEELAQCMKDQAEGGCLFFQLYVKKKQEETKELIRRARALGFKALMVTVDTPVVGKRELDDRHKADLALKAGDESGMGFRNPRARPTEDGVVPVHRGPYSSTLNWDDLRWIREEWGDSGPIVLKGIGTAEDVKLACDSGYRYIYLSNHGGRQLDSAPSALRTLIEIRKFCPEVFSQCEILIDGGARRGADILKALCLGASSVGFGRPFMYALSAYGTDGVLKAIQMLSDELETCMRLLGVTSLDELRPHMVNARSLELEMMTDLPGFNHDRAKL